MLLQKRCVFNCCF